MKLKNLIYLLPFSVMGCVGLEQYPTNSYTDANFWQNEDNVLLPTTIFPMMFSGPAIQKTNVTLLPVRPIRLQDVSAVSGMHVIRS